LYSGEKMIEQKEAIEPEVEVPEIPKAEKEAITPRKMREAEGIQPVFSLEEEFKRRWAEVLEGRKIEEEEKGPEAPPVAETRPAPEQLSRLEELLNRPDLGSSEQAAELEEEILNTRG
jgi:hypothetical protein